MKKIKIFYVITGLKPGGAELQLMKLVNSMNKNKYNITIISITGGEGDEVFDSLTKNGFSTISLKMNSSLQLLSAIKKLRKLIQANEPDIIHSYLFHANIISRLAAKNLKVKVISSIREKCVVPWMNILDKYTQHLVDQYTVNSYVVGEHIKQYGITKKWKYIPNILPLEYFTIKRNVQDGFILMVSNPRKQKDIPTAIETMCNINKLYPNLKLKIAGGGTEFQDQTEKLQKLVNKYNLQNNVEFLGYVDNIKPLLSEAIIWFSTTLYEGQSNALLEAMAAGCPIVTTNIPENKELITHNENGLLFIPSSVHKATKHIINLLNCSKLRQELSNNAKNRVSTFNIEETVKLTEHMYTTLLKNG